MKGLCQMRVATKLQMRIATGPASPPSCMLPDSTPSRTCNVSMPPPHPCSLTPHPFPYLECLHAAYEGRQSGERLSSAAAHPHTQHVAPLLAQNPARRRGGEGRGGKTNLMVSNPD